MGEFKDFSVRIFLFAQAHWEEDRTLVYFNLQ